MPNRFDKIIPNSVVAHTELYQYENQILAQVDNGHVGRNFQLINLLDIIEDDHLHSICNDDDIGVIPQFSADQPARYN